MGNYNKALISTLVRGDIVCIDLDNGFIHRIDNEPRVYIVRIESVEERFGSNAPLLHYTYLVSEDNLTPRVFTKEELEGNFQYKYPCCDASYVTHLVARRSKKGPVARRDYVAWDPRFVSGFRPVKTKQKNILCGPFREVLHDVISRNPVLHGSTPVDYEKALELWLKTKQGFIKVTGRGSHQVADYNREWCYYNEKSLKSWVVRNYNRLLSTKQKLHERAFWIEEEERKIWENEMGL